MVAAYLDASVVVPAFLSEPDSSRVNAWLRQSRDSLLVSDLASAEVSSAISIALRMDRIDRNEADEILSSYDLWRASLTKLPETSPEDVREAETFIRRFDLKLRTPDAIHAATAHRIGATLITLDRRLLAAADALGIAAANPIAAHT